MKPRKLIRDKVKEVIQVGEAERITDQTELNELYALKIKEELIEIQLSDHKDPKEFADLIDVAVSFAIQNGFTYDEIFDHCQDKLAKKGMYTNLVLNNLNPDNPSNKMYFEGANKD
jgi:predicted house-cleaning noncanonical NTP pyrophosphatase (MazG superfamily)